MLIAVDHGNYSIHANVISVFIDEHVVCEERFGVKSHHARFEKCVGRFNVVG